VQDLAFVPDGKGVLYAASGRGISKLAAR